jgi:hypothetical protein
VGLSVAQTKMYVVVAKTIIHVSKTEPRVKGAITPTVLAVAQDYYILKATVTVPRLTACISLTGLLFAKPSGRRSQYGDRGH